MKKNKITESLKKQLKELNSNRNEINEYLNNFLRNYSVYASTMHSRITRNDDLEQIKVASYQYLSSIISCWETFYRDVFVFLLSIDENLKNETVRKLKLSDSAIQTIQDEVDINNYLAKSYNFQNMEDIKDAFSPIFDLDIFEKTAKDDFLTFSPQKNQEYYFLLEMIFPDYMEMIENALEIRHKIIHDANYIRQASFNVSYFQKTETLFLLLPQVLSKLLSDKYNLEVLFIRNDVGCYYYLFTIDDLISNDWIVEE